MTQTDFEKLPNVEQNFRWDLFLLSDGYERTPSELELLELLRMYTEQYSVNDVEIDYITGTDDLGDYSYWQYREKSGYGFSGPNTDYFIKDVLRHLKDDVELLPFYSPKSLDISK